jgi:hypothetical protein
MVLSTEFAHKIIMPDWAIPNLFFEDLAEGLKAGVTAGRVVPCQKL